jgi:SAM-dependent methyltransferase
MLASQIMYYQSFREDVIRLVPANVKRALSIGCGTAITEGKLKSQLNIPFVVGVEINETIASIAKTRIDDVIIGDGETINLPFSAGFFDLLICADVLEHFNDPWNALKIYAQYLRRGGYLILSVPNVRFYYIIWQLAVCGRWEYQDRGIMDRTHLRFFTLHEINLMLQITNFEIVHLNRNFRLVEKISHKYRTLAKILSLYVFREFFTFQYVILCKKL